MMADAKRMRGSNQHKKTPAPGGAPEASSPEVPLVAMNPYMIARHVNTRSSYRPLDRVALASRGIVVPIGSGAELGSRFSVLPLNERHLRFDASSADSIR